MSTAAHHAHDHGHHDHGHADEWHTHDASEPAPQAPHTNEIHAGMVLGVFFGIVVFVVASVAALMIIFNHFNAVKKATVTEQSLAEEYRPMRERVERDLYEQQYKVGDAASSSVQIPLAQAMEKVLKQSASNKMQLPAPSGTPAPGTIYRPEGSQNGGSSR